MIYATDFTKLLLKYQKAKAKLVEFQTDKNEYPHFKADSEDLFYFTIFLLSRYSENVVYETDSKDNSREKLFGNLELVSQYYDACFNSKEHQEYSNEFLLLGLSAYFLSKKFGSAKVLCNIINKNHFDNDSPQFIIIEIVSFLLNGNAITDAQNQYHNNINTYFQYYFSNGSNYENLIASAFEYKNSVIEKNDPLEVVMVNTLLAIIMLLKEQSAWAMLSKHTDFDAQLWTKYLNKSNSIKIFWEAQELIAKSGILNGKSGIVQLPTGVGKTKGIELIIESGLISDRIKNCIIVSPLRALCNEISSDLMTSLGEEVNITQFSDVLQLDFNLEFLNEETSNIIVCTPEKLSYVLYHECDIFNLIDLLVFDEAHLFDDGTRGVNYELLLSEIRSRIDFDEQQLVLLSAVLPNSDEICSWLFDENGVIAKSDTLQGTPKTYAFTSKSRDLHYYSNDFEEEDYFVPNSFDIKELKKLGRERKIKKFPNTDDSKDIAIYYSIKLCHNGGIAIFVNRTDTVTTVISRIVDLNNHEYDLSNIINNSNRNEINKLSKLIKTYYGDEHVFSRASELGVFPHYSKLPNGIRIAIENAYKKGLICFIVCTSTLAQGVNIPIKYLFLTSNKNDFDNMQARSFHNLIGRTARSGMYTGGDIVFSNPIIFDKKRSHDKDYYFWRKCTDILNPNSSEPCSSSILTLINDFNIDYKTLFLGSDISDFIINNYNKYDDVISALYQDLSVKIKSDVQKMKFESKMAEIRTSMQSVESYLCFAFANNSIYDTLELSDILCRNTLAYHLVDEDKKRLLLKIFELIANKVSSIPKEIINRYANSMTGIITSTKIENWLNENFSQDADYSAQELLKIVVDCYIAIYHAHISNDLLYSVAEKWICGKPFSSIVEETALSFKEVEKMCIETISYNMSFLTGNILDLLDWSDVENYNFDNLFEIQKKLKYGVNGATEILFCDRLLNDRVVASVIRLIIGPQKNYYRMIKAIKKNRELILNTLEPYPSVFRDRIESID